MNFRSMLTILLVGLAGASSAAPAPPQPGGAPRAYLPALEAFAEGSGLAQSAEILPRPDWPASSASEPAGAAVILARDLGFEPKAGLAYLRFPPDAVPGGPPAIVALSNDPERVNAPRLLSQYVLPAAQRIHFMWHHIGEAAEGLQLVARLRNLGDAPARVYLTGAHGGPSSDEMFVGHVVMRRFLSAWQEGTGSVFEIPARRGCEISRRGLPLSHTVSGMAEVTLLDGGPVLLETLSCSRDGAPVELAALRKVSVDPWPNSLQLPGTRRLEVAHNVGGAWTFARVGRNDDYPDHPSLRGDYGVLHDVQVGFDNPDRRAARLELALRAGGGVARGAVVVDGRVVETGLLAFGGEAVVFSEKIASETKRTIGLRIIPQAASNYPVTLIARSFVSR